MLGSMLALVSKHLLMTRDLTIQLEPLVGTWEELINRQNDRSRL